MVGLCSQLDQESKICCKSDKIVFFFCFFFKILFCWSVLKVIMSLCELPEFCRSVRIRIRTGWGGRWSQAAHAQWVGKAIENAELCRAVRKTSWTPPLGTTAGVLEVSPGDCGTGGRLLTGVNNKAIPGGKKPLSSPRQAIDEPAPSPSVSPALLSCFRLRKRGSETMLPLNV